MEQNQPPHEVNSLTVGERVTLLAAGGAACLAVKYGLFETAEEGNNTFDVVAGSIAGAAAIGLGIGLTIHRGRKIRNSAADHSES